MFQFGHIEGYARKPNKGFGVDGIWREAERVPGYCNHVKDPRPYGLVYGCSPREAAELATAWGDQAREAGGRRRLRRDAPVLLGGVLSYPRTGDDWGAFKVASVAWLKQKYGKHLKSVIEHHDEEHPHLHFYCVPEFGQEFNELHEGRRAAQEAKRKGERKCIQVAASGKAMAGWQDELYHGVSRELGLMRFGPKRLRIPNRAEWQAHQTATRAMLAAEKASQEAIAKMQAGIERQYQEARQELASRAAEVREQQAELKANPPTSKIKEVNATLKEQNTAFKGQNVALKSVLKELFAVLDDEQLSKLADTMPAAQQQLVLAVLDEQDNGYSPS